MPVRKFRSVADMPDATWRPALDPRNLELAFQISALAMRLAPARFPAGVYRYRSIEQASDVRARWEHESQLPRRPL